MIKITSLKTQLFGIPSLRLYRLELICLVDLIKILYFKKNYQHYGSSSRFSQIKT